MTSTRSTTETAVALHSVTVSFGCHRALDDVTLDVHRGEVTALAGANGAGKSTLIDVLAGFRRPDTGVVRRSVPDRVAIVPQQIRRAERLPVTVRDVVTMGRWAHRGLWRPLRRQDRAEVESAMRLLAISDLAERPITALSGGQRQRAFLAQGVAQRADVLLLDEPATGLDETSAGVAIAAIREEAARGVAVVIATHDHDTLSLADSVVTLRNGVSDVSPLRG